MIVEKPTAEEVGLFRLWKARRMLTSNEAACLCLGLTPCEYGTNGEPQMPITEGIEAEAQIYNDNFNEFGLYEAGFRVEGKFNTWKVNRHFLLNFFNEIEEHPAFLYPETWADDTDTTANPTQDAATPPPVGEQSAHCKAVDSVVSDDEWQRFPDPLKAAIIYWRKLYDSGDEPLERRHIIETLHRDSLVSSQNEAEAIDKIIRPYKVKKGKSAI